MLIYLYIRVSSIFPASQTANKKSPIATEFHFGDICFAVFGITFPGYSEVAKKIERILYIAAPGNYHLENETMLIMREPGSENKTQFRIRMTDSVYKEIDEYCQWAGIRTRDYFIEKACQHIFKNDEEWINFKKSGDSASSK